MDERPDIRIYLDSERGAKVQAKKSPILSFVAMTAISGPGVRDKRDLRGAELGQ